MKKHLVIFVALFFISAASFAQTSNFTIKGIVVDSLDKGVGFATIALLDSANVVAANAADASGKFSLTYAKSGKYKLQITFVGYAPHEKQVELNTQKSIDLGRITLGQGVMIDDIVVVGQLITSDIDKMTYNTAVDPETPSLTALEMMRKVPMLSVDAEETLQLKGQGNFKILVNGKENSMMSKNYKEVLRSMPASSIKNIEVITNPPAKYDAEGVAGIINIVTERKTPNLYNGSINARVDNMGSFGAGGYFATSLGKFSMSANVGTGKHLSPKTRSTTSTTNMNKDDDRYLNTVLGGSSSGLSHNLSVDMSYEIDSLNLLSFSISGYLGDYSSRNRIEAEFLNASEELQKGYVNNMNNGGDYGSVSGNIDWQKSFKKPEKTLTTSYRFDFNPNGSNYDSFLEGFGGYESRYQRSNNDGRGSEHTLQLDYYDPLAKKHIIELGVKAVIRINTSNTLNEEFTEDGWVENIERKNDLDYQQYITSGYGSYQFQLDKFSLKSGFRGEFTVNTGEFKQETNQSLSAQYFNIVPYLTMSYKITNSKNITWGYNQRLRRPSIWYLNPYVNDSDPDNISTGNPELDSELYHRASVKFNSFSQNLNYGVDVDYSFSDNAIENITTMRADGVRSSSYENCGRRNNVSISGFGGVNMLKGKIRVNANLNANYVNIRSTKSSEINNKGWSYNIGGSFYAQTWKNANVNIFAGYNTPRVHLQSRSSSFLYSSLSVSQSFLEKKTLRVNVFVNNPFSKYRTFHNESFGPGYTSVSDYSVVFRRFGVGVQWSFGKVAASVKKANRGINNDDKMGGDGNGNTSSVPAQ